MSSGVGWRDIADNDSVAGYDARMEDNLAEVAAAGRSVHAEADLVARLATPGALVLDGGCGTGRIAWPLAQMGYRVVGVDSDLRMLSQAYARAGKADVAHQPDWVEADLKDAPDLGAHIVLLAGNVVPLVGVTSLPSVLARMRQLLEPRGGVLVSGFGLGTAHLPDGCQVTELADFDAIADDCGLRLRARWGTWDGEPFFGDYVVSVHQLTRA